MLLELWLVMMDTGTLGIVRPSLTLSYGDRYIFIATTI